MRREMNKNLLIGNGVNPFQGIYTLSAKSIANRFVHIAPRYNSIINALFGVSLTQTFIDIIGRDFEEKGIETIAEEVYKYIWKASQKEHSMNFQYRLLDIINSICLTSIFFERTKKVNLMPVTKMFDVSMYERVFTLNYMETWDVQKQSIHLHGRFDPNSIVLDSDKDVLLIGRERLALNEVR